MPLRLLLLLLCLWGLPLQRAETDSEGQTTGELYQRWERYGRECQETLETADPPSGETRGLGEQEGGAGRRSWQPKRKIGRFRGRVLGAQRSQSHLVDHSHPHPSNHLGRASLASSRLCSGVSHSGEAQRQPPVPPPNRMASGSVSLSSQINFLIFIRILGILVSKLRTRQMRCPDYRLRLARSTLTLVPLLGVHEVVFAPVTEEQAEGALRFAKLAFEIFLSSFQGFLVSVLYCFINKEVQSEIRRGWRHRRLRLSLGEERPGPHVELRPPALPSRSAPREAPIGSALPSGLLH
ncbi:hypothetical protein A6R68_06622, partial [Neotoma lepida]